MSAKKFYFFNVSFALTFGGGTQFSAHIMRADKATVTAKDLHDFKGAAQVAPEAIVMAVSPLGRMTQEEFNPPHREALTASPAYIKGMEDGLWNQNGKSPYLTDSIEDKDYLSAYAVGLGLSQKKNVIMQQAQFPDGQAGS